MEKAQIKFSEEKNRLEDEAAAKETKLNKQIEKM